MFLLNAKNCIKIIIVKDNSAHQNKFIWNLKLKLKLKGAAYYHAQLNLSDKCREIKGL